MEKSPILEKRKNLLQYVRQFSKFEHFFSQKSCVLSPAGILTQRIERGEKQKKYY
jgi:hypothetical protein